MSGAGVERVNISPADVFGPGSLEARRDIPVSIRERVWGGEGVLAGLSNPPSHFRDVPDPLTLMDGARRLRATERSRGTVYGGSDSPTPIDQNRTRKLSPLRRPQTLGDVLR